MSHPNGAERDPEWVRVGATVRALREAYALDQTELAARARMGRSLLVRVEGGTKRLTPANARAVAAVLGVRPIAILNPEHFTDELSQHPQEAPAPSAATAAVAG